MKRIEISGSLITTSALHIGAGWDAIRDVELSPTQQARRETADAGFAAVQLDCNQAPCIPGSTLKGVLRARALRTGIDDAIVTRVFGGSDSDNPSIGGVQFLVGRWAGYPFAPKCDEAGAYGKNTLTLPLARHARDRKTKAVENKKLFTKDVVADGAKFDIRLRIARDNVTEEDITILLGLLNAFDGTTEGITLGAGSGSGLGAAKWSLSQVTTLQQTNAPDLWDTLLKGQFVVKKTALAAAPLSTPENCISVDLEIPIDGPFLSHGGVKKASGIEEFVPRRTRNGEPVYSGTSLRGALRSQAERICRTVGLEVDDPAHPFEPLHVLFGSEKRKGALRFSDFVATGGSGFSQEFVAIDRFTGGAAEGLKFKGNSVLDPTLKGQVIIDLKMLEASSEQTDHTDAALGLALLALRDLDEGDVPLGYGAAAKGYGQVRVGCATMAAVGNCITLARNKPVEDFYTRFQSLIPAEVKAVTYVAAEPDVSGAPADLRPTAVNGDFHNPYQFIPTQPQRPTTGSWTSKSDFDRRAALHHWHDRYATSTKTGACTEIVYSGRIECTLEAITPLVVGGTQCPGPNNTTRVNPFRWGQTNDAPLAIPATSLRGMIGSVIEQASQSAMRVLNNQAMSVRMEFENTRLGQNATAADLSQVAHPLSAVGRVVRFNGQLRLEPLVLPTLYADIGRNAVIPVAYRAMFPDTKISAPIYRSLPLKCLFGNYGNDGGQLGRFVKNHNFGNSDHFAMRYPDLDIVGGELRVPNIEGLHARRMANFTTVIGVEAAALPVKDLDDVGLEIGLVRAFQFLDRKEMPGPRSRKHEMFLPLPLLALDQSDQPAPAECELRQKEALTADESKLNHYFKHHTFPFTVASIARFAELADERTRAQDNKNPESVNQFPYVAKGYARLPSQMGKDDKIQAQHPERGARIKPGDLVFFRPDASGKFVAEFAFSSLWRKRVEQNASAWRVDHAFSAIDPDLVPMNEHRTKISPAEWLLGFVADGKRAPEISESVSAFAGKLRMSHGRGLEGDLQPALREDVKLKILGSPKLPSPAMYFRPVVGADRFVAKSEFANKPQDFRPRGRKVYTHAHRRNDSVANLTSEGALDGSVPPWASIPAGNDDGNKQRMTVTPIAPQSQFRFHIDFDNLSQSELELLCFALQPSKGHEHRLGLGKSIGLGSVKISTTSLQIIDRISRYSTTSQQRYLTHSLSVSALATAGAKAAQTINAAAYQALVLTGDPNAVKRPVHTPQLAGDQIESDTYKWFVDNTPQDNQHAGAQQFVAEIAAGSAALPTLLRRSRKLPPQNR